VIAAATPQHLPGVLHSLEPTLNHHGYLAVVGLVLVEDFGVPVPGETVLILAAVYAGAGRLNVMLVALLGFLGAVAGDNIGFAIGHFGGRPLLERYGRYIFLNRERIDRATGFFARYGGWIIIVARFIEGLRQANGIIAGVSGIHWAKFLLFNSIGAALWVACATHNGWDPIEIDASQKKPASAATPVPATPTPGIVPAPTAEPPAPVSNIPPPLISGTIESIFADVPSSSIGNISVR